jgi:hypothetical protein
MPTEIGQPGPFLLPTSYTHRLREGVTTQIRYKVRTHDLQAWLNTYASSFEYQAEPIPGSPYSSVTISNSASIAPDAVIANIWGVSYTEINASAWANPNVKAQLKLATTDQANLWHDMVVRFLAGEQIYTVSTLVPGSPPPYDTPSVDVPLTSANLISYATAFGMDGAYMGQFIESLGKGTDEIIFSFPTLRRSIIRPANTDLSPVFSDVGTIFSTAGLLAYEPSIPANLSVDLPDGWWQRKSPAAEQQDDGRWHYQIEYWYVGTEYDPFIFDTPVTTQAQADALTARHAPTHIPP